MMNCIRTIATVALAFAALSSIAVAQPGGRGGPAVVSPEVLPDGRVTFRVLAPDAAKVMFVDDDGITSSSSTGPAPANGLAFTKNQDGVWEATYGPLPPGAYRYAFRVDGVKALDPVNTRTSESNTTLWSLFTVPGSPLMDMRDVPHGAVASVFYYSAVLKTTRRMHVYTPPGYEAGNQKYPVFYLLHGAMDCDDSWTSVGRAGFILDNLLADKKIKPMIVVMPAGHQPGQPFAMGATRMSDLVNPFTSEFMTDIMPYVEKHYRTINDRPHRAIAGLSMGGAQTLDIAFRHLDQFAYIGVFSSGATLGRGRRPPAAPTPGAAAATAPAPPPQPDWETVHKAGLDNAALKKGLKLIWLSTGVGDGVIASTRTTVEILKKHGFEPVFKESPGVHSWINWRNYLIEFAPQLF